MVKVVAHWSTLFHYAKMEAQARASGDPEALARAEAKHEAYRQVCLAADEMQA